MHEKIGDISITYCHLVFIMMLCMRLPGVVCCHLVFIVCVLPPGVYYNVCCHRVFIVLLPTVYYNNFRLPSLVLFLVTSLHEVGLLISHLRTLVVLLSSLALAIQEY